MVLADDRCLTYAVGKYGPECQPLRRLLPGAFQHQMHDPTLIIFQCQPPTFVLFLINSIQFVCGGFEERVAIPDDRSSWSQFSVIGELVLRKITAEGVDRRFNLTYVMKWLMMTRSLPQTRGLNAYDLIF